MNSLTFGYDGQPSLYENVDFGLDLDARIALVGPNGAGKSTLVKVGTQTAQARELMPFSQCPPAFKHASCHTRTHLRPAASAALLCLPRR